MTFEECQQHIATLRAKQGTRHPVVRVDYAGAVYRGRVARSDTDRDGAGRTFGVLVLEDPGLARGPATLLQIANIPAGGIADMDRN